VQTSRGTKTFYVAWRWAPATSPRLRYELRRAIAGWLRAAGFSSFKWLTVGGRAGGSRPTGAGARGSSSQQLRVHGLCGSRRRFGFDDPLESGRGIASFVVRTLAGAHTGPVRSGLRTARRGGRRVA